MTPPAGAGGRRAAGRVAIAFALVVALFGAPALAAVIQRGPYLQTGTPTSVVVKWRTDAGSTSRVLYGTQPTNLTTAASNSTSTTNHEVTLTGLQPATRYYYSVGDGTTILAGGSDYTFLTPPLAGTAVPTRIWAIGDAGTADSNARAVRDAYKTFTGSTPTNLWLMLGDNAYTDGTDSDFQSAVFTMYPEMLRKSVVWPTLGNHDAHSADSGSQSGPYYSIFTLPKRGEAGGLASGTEAYYSYDYGNIHFVCLDSSDSSRSSTGAMLNWLKADLDATDQTWIIAYWHHPPYSKGSHDSDSEANLKDMRQNALPILEQRGVDLVLGGHSHSYERSFLLDGHYGSSSTLTSAMKLDGGDGRTDGTGAYAKESPGPAPHEGAVYVVAGSSGKTDGVSHHPAMYIWMSTLGSMVIDVNGSRMDAKFLSSSGSVRDHFTIIKGSSTPPPSPPVAASSLVATAASASAVNLTWHDNSDNEAGFRIERCLGASCTSFVQVATAPAGATSHQDSGLAASTAYVYRVQAFNAAGGSAFSNTAGAVTQAAAPPPTPGQTLFQDDFEDGVDNGWTKAAGTWSVISDGSRVFDQSTTSGDALASAGDVTWRDVAVSAEVKPVSFNSSGGFTKLLARYTDPLNHYYLLLRSNNVLEMRKLVGGAKTTLASKSLSVAPGVWYKLRLEVTGSSLKAYVNDALQLSVTDSSLAGGCVGVGAYNARAEFDDVVVLAPEEGNPVTAPLAPSGLAAAAISSSAIGLSWADSSDNEAGFRIERCPGTTCTSFVQVATAPAGATSHQDSGLAASTAYVYRVQAFNAAGGSAFSNTAGAVTQAAAPPPTPGQTLFQDDFEDGVDHGWTKAAGIWSVISDGSRVLEQSTTSGDALLSAGDVAWRDYAVSAEVKPVSFNSSGGFTKLLARYTDPLNHYFLLLRSNNVLEMRKLVGGVKTTLASKSLSVAPGVWYKLRLEVAGSSLKAYVNDTPQLSVTDGSLAGGRVGVGAYNARAEFDDVIVNAPAK
jgi:hypothetical protein